MPHAVATPRWWLVVLVTAGWSAAHLRGLGTLQLVLPVLFAVGVLLLWRAPLLASLLVCGTQGATLLSDASPLSPAGLVPGLVCLLVLGLTTPPHRALPVVSLFLSIIVLTDLPAVRVAIGVAFFLTTWALADQVRRHRQRLASDRELADRLAAQDARALAERVVARERRLLVARSAHVVHAALTEVRERADQASHDLDPVRVADVRLRAVAAIDELRDLLGLVREDADEQSTARPSSTDAEAARTSRQDPVWLRDVALACGVLVVGLADLHLDAFDEPVATYALGVALAATLALRRTRTALATALAAAVMCAALVTSTPMSHGLAESAVLALVTWTAVGSGRRLAMAWWAALLGVTVLVAQQRGESYPEVIAGLMLAIGVTSRVHGMIRDDQLVVTTRVATLEAAAEAVVSEALAQGRAGLARDLHDVVGHALGVMVMQAGAAERAGDPAAARAALAHVAGTGDDALAELAALSPDGGSPEASGDGLITLVHRLRSAGVDLEVTGGLDLPPGEAAAVLHRVVQESLTNAIKHAPGAPVRLGLTRGGDVVHVEISNEPAKMSAPGPGTRSGLSGLTQRVSAAGGLLRAEAMPDGGFRVRATLPLAPRPTPRPTPESGPREMVG